HHAVKRSLLGTGSTHSYRQHSEFSLRSFDSSREAAARREPGSRGAPAGRRQCIMLNGPFFFFFFGGAATGCPVMSPTILSIRCISLNCFSRRLTSSTLVP